MSGKIGRNDPCPCGSGEKYKRCHNGPKAAKVTEVHASTLEELLDSNLFQNYSALLGLSQNIFRRAYWAIETEPEDVQQETLTRIKETVRNLSPFNEHFVSRYLQNQTAIKRELHALHALTVRKGLALTEFKPPQRTYTAGKIRSRQLKRDSLDPGEDFRQDEAFLLDYRQRLSSLLPRETAPASVVVGVMAGGVYHAGTFMFAAEQQGMECTMVIAKKSRHEERVHMYPGEEEQVRLALQAGKKVYVLDDMAYGFGTFTSIFEYFGCPQEMCFSAGFYNGPLPQNLYILERPLLEYLTHNLHKIRFADKALQMSLATILQYHVGITAAKPFPFLLPPVVNI